MAGACWGAVESRAVTGACAGWDVPWGRALAGHRTRAACLQPVSPSAGLALWMLPCTSRPPLEVAIACSPRSARDVAGCPLCFHDVTCSGALFGFPRSGQRLLLVKPTLGCSRGFVASRTLSPSPRSSLLSPRRLSNVGIETGITSGKTPL